MLRAVYGAPGGSRERCSISYAGGKFSHGRSRGYAASSTIIESSSSTSSSNVGSQTSTSRHVSAWDCGRASHPSTSSSPTGAEWPFHHPCCLLRANSRICNLHSTHATRGRNAHQRWPDDPRHPDSIRGYAHQAQGARSGLEGEKEGTGGWRRSFDCGPGPRWEARTDGIQYREGTHICGGKSSISQGLHPGRSVRNAS